MDYYDNAYESLKSFKKTLQYILPIRHHRLLTPLSHNILPIIIITNFILPLSETKDLLFKISDHHKKLGCTAYNDLYSNVIIL
jgi:hypothetical protein